MTSLRETPVRAHVDAGRASLEAGHPSEARVHFRRALQLEPEDRAAILGMRESLQKESWLLAVIGPLSTWRETAPRDWACQLFVAFWAVSGLLGWIPLPEMLAWLEKVFLGLGLLAFLVPPLAWFLQPLAKTLWCLSDDGRLALLPRERRVPRLSLVGLALSIGCFCAAGLFPRGADQGIALLLVGLAVLLLSMLSIQRVESEHRGLGVLTLGLVVVLAILGVAWAVGTSRVEPSFRESFPLELGLLLVFAVLLVMWFGHYPYLSAPAQEAAADPKTP